MHHDRAWTLHSPFTRLTLGACALPNRSTHQCGPLARASKLFDECRPTSSKRRLPRSPCRKGSCVSFTPHANGAKVGRFGPFRGDLAGKGDAELAPLSFQPAE